MHPNVDVHAMHKGNVHLFQYIRVHAESRLLNIACHKLNAYLRSSNKLSWRPTFCRFRILHSNLALVCTRHT